MSSSEDYSHDFRKMKEGEEKMPINMEDLEWEEYNEPYKMKNLNMHCKTVMVRLQGPMESIIKC
jgi:hypothetical protein